MALDGIVIRAVVQELQAFVGGRIHKIHQPSEHDLLIQIRAQGQTHKLLLSANPTYPRVHLTDESFINPTDAPMFCMLMRKHCEGGLLESIEQDGLERIIRFQMKQRDELGDVSSKTIVVELMGRHSNIILLDSTSNTILDGIHHVTPAISSYRIVMPGTAYTRPPEQGKQHPLLIDKSHFLALFHTDSESHSSLASVLVAQLSGISPLVATEIVHRAGGDTVHPTQLFDAFEQVMQLIRTHRYDPNQVEQLHNGKSAFSVIPLTHLTGITKRYTSPSLLLTAYYAEKALRDTVRQRTTDLQRFLQNEIAKNKKKLEKLSDTLVDARQADKFRVLGELLTASLHLSRRGDKSINVINYYEEDQPTITIELDPLQSPAENAQRYFKKYNKAKSSLIIVEQQISETQSDNRYFETVLQQLQDANLADIEEIREELIDQGFIRFRGKKGVKKKKPTNPVLTGYVSSEGVPILVGKNNTQNEYLTCRLAAANDTWLHTKDIPGSHVVIRGASFGQATLLEAAQLAGYFSQAKSSSSVPVDYTLIRHVKKPNGAKPGYVIYDHQRTLFVTPNEQIIHTLQPLAKA
jgi:predicted ribosome quality control (RQC) complex YloA/Tae2 family protein